MGLLVFCFLDCQVYICDFHREQAWERWLAKSSNGLTDRKQSVLAKLRAIARARTEQEYLDKLDHLKKSEEWRSNSNLRNYITKTWLPQHKVHNSLLSGISIVQSELIFFVTVPFQRWVWAFRKDRLLTTINTNNGVERQNKSFKHEYLEGHQQATLSCMLSILIEEFLPDKYLK